ncbi:hypothetical protein DSO57_1029219 [Entomophthora muscae]|uniref:Uncharacterized protein n=1 Tax=Entomophthora muscae TaxID=34485 RepID=A0ACC2UA73_9FUNG|nr:hypothetical protein DSO57_1029219 [Entomophthora muscae]
MSYNTHTRVILKLHKGSVVQVNTKVCDRCRLRKVRCISNKEGCCLGCASFFTTCTFRNVHKPKRCKKKTTCHNAISPQLASPFIPTKDFTIPHFNDLEKYCLHLN